MSHSNSRGARRGHSQARHSNHSHAHASESQNRANRAERFATPEPPKTAARDADAYGLVSKGSGDGGSGFLSLRDPRNQKALYAIVRRLSDELPVASPGDERAQKARVDGLKHIVLQYRKLREGIISTCAHFLDESGANAVGARVSAERSRESDLFALKVYEEAADASLTAGELAEFLKCASSLVTVLYPALAVPGDPATLRECEFGGLYVLYYACAVGDGAEADVGQILSTLSARVLQSPEVAMALRVYLAVRFSDYVSFFRCLSRATQHQRTVMMAAVPSMRSRGVAVIAKAYMSIPSLKLCAFLGFDCEASHFDSATTARPGDDAFFDGNAPPSSAATASDGVDIARCASFLLSKGGVAAEQLSPDKRTVTFKAPAAARKG